MNNRTSSNEAASDLLGDALSSVARSSRRNLIILSTLCLIVSKTGLNPSNLQFPFFKMENLPESYVVYGLLGFTVFSFISFLAHATSDYFRFKNKKDIYNLAIALYVDEATNTPTDKEQEFEYKEFEDQTDYKSFYIPHQVTKTIYFVKSTMDFIFPIFYGGISILIFIKCVF